MNRNIFMKKAVVLLLALSISCIAFAYEGDGNLIIKIKNDKGSALSGVGVFVKAAAEKKMRTGSTGEDGNAVFQRLNPGTYKVIAMKKGFLMFYASDITVYRDKSTKNEVVLKEGLPEEATGRRSKRFVKDNLSAVDSLMDNNNGVSGLPEKKNPGAVEGSPANPMTGNSIFIVSSDGGQVLPGATVKLSSSALKGERTQTTGQNGRATFRNLPPGEYSVEVWMDGFVTAIENGLEINPGKTLKTEETLILNEYRWFRNFRDMGPIIDTLSSTIKHRFDAEHISKYLP